MSKSETEEKKDKLDLLQEEVDKVDEKPKLKNVTKSLWSWLKGSVGDRE